MSGWIPGCARQNSSSSGMRMATNWIDAARFSRGSDFFFRQASAWQQINDRDAGQKRIHSLRRLSYVSPGCEFGLAVARAFLIVKDVGLSLGKRSFGRIAECPIVAGWLPSCRRRLTPGERMN